ncbi:MAG: DNA cytosine methyltransferase [Paludibacteraceae bacterium]|nr:DNA cytosine methyltransferase [Paludibacteraceae bacterium]
MNIVSLFANIGVAEAYLKDLGFHVSVANELIPERAALYQSIYPDTKMICGNIAHKPIRDSIISQSIESHVDIVMATPPCQGMSTAGRKKNALSLNHLFLYAIDIINAVNPQYFIFENVTAFMNTYIEIDKNKKLIPDIIKEKLARNYHIQFNSIDASNYGVPQYRGRVIVLGTRKDIEKTWTMPHPDTHKVTMKDAIGDIPIIDPYIRDIKEDEFKRQFPLYEKRRKIALKISKWNIPPKHVFRQVYVMQHTPTGRSAFDNPQEFLPRKANGDVVKGFHNTYKRQNWDRPAYTIAMDNIEISSQNNVHPGRLIGKDEKGFDIYSDARALTLYELMRIMTIPDNWPLPDDVDITMLRRVIGEGVPSLLIRRIFQQLI